MAKVVLNSAAIRKLMQSEEVREDIERRAKAIAEAAGGEPDFLTDVDVVGDRVMGRVFTATDAGMRAEATDRALTRALDAGRS